MRGNSINVSFRQIFARLQLRVVCRATARVPGNRHARRLREAAGSNADGPFIISRSFRLINFGSCENNANADALLLREKRADYAQLATERSERKKEEKDVSNGRPNEQRKLKWKREKKLKQNK